MSALLRHQVMQLRLRPEAPFPAECQDHRDMVKSWRRLQRLHLAGAGIRLESGVSILSKRSSRQVLVGKTAK